MIFNTRYLDVIASEIKTAKITVENGLFIKIEPISIDEVDCEGIMIPGFIDPHIHIESTMLTPAQFARVAVMWGVTSVVADPHEIANVMGIGGIDFMIENSKSVPFDFYFSAPSCVPATPFESAGASLTSKEVQKLLEKDEIIALGEMLNFPGVLNEDPEVLKKLELTKLAGKVIDGHAPLLSGDDLKKYISFGISSDHESSLFEEALEKKELGMSIFVRDGSTARNLEALLDAKKREEFFLLKLNKGEISQDEFKKSIKTPIFDCICSDDKHTHELIDGYLRNSLLKAVDCGVDIFEAIKMITINPAKHYGLNSGCIALNHKANFSFIDNFEDFNILKTYIDGRIVFEDEIIFFEAPEIAYFDSIKLDEKSPKDFDILSDDENVEVNIIKVIDGDLGTEKLTANLNTQNGVVMPDLDRDILKIANVQRYGDNTVANAFVNGFGFKKGAIASSISHDSHNIIVVGTNSEDMARAVNILMEVQGGISIVDGDFENYLDLPITGLMCNKPAEEVALKMSTLNEQVDNLNSNLKSPFMALAFLALLVIPSIKLSDKGLFDCENFEFIDVIIN